MFGEVTDVRVSAISVVRPGSLTKSLLRHCSISVVGGACHVSMEAVSKVVNIT
jgi:hypothetical protein